MSLDRPAITLGTGARGVQDVRRWVVSACREIGRPDLAECAELGVSELVTNALLHGAHPIEVRLRGTEEHPRVEVHDGSPTRPVLPHEADTDELLLTFGRGLALVARAADAWGAEIEEHGKTVWFAPAGSFAEDAGVEGLVSGTEHWLVRVEQPPVDPVDVSVRKVPVRLLLGFRHHFRELRREIRLLALAHETDYPQAKSLSELFVTLESQLTDKLSNEQLERAIEARHHETDVVVTVSRAATGLIKRFLDVLDLADEFCREERLLSLARTAEQRSFVHWYLGEFVRQGDGQRPREWSGTNARTTGPRCRTAACGDPLPAAAAPGRGGPRRRRRGGAALAGRRPGARRARFPVDHLRDQRLRIAGAGGPARSGRRTPS